MLYLHTVIDPVDTVESFLWEGKLLQEMFLMVFKL